MKWSMTLAEDSAQFNLEAENPHERELCKILSKFEDGSVRIHQGVSIAQSNGGYLREYERKPEICAITIRKPVPVTLPSPIHPVGEIP